MDMEGKDVMNLVTVDFKLNEKKYSKYNGYSY